MGVRHVKLHASICPTNKQLTVFFLIFSLMIECSNGALELNSTSMIFQSKIKTTSAALKSLMFLLAKKKYKKPVCLESFALIALRLPTSPNYHKNPFTTNGQLHLSIFCMLRLSHNSSKALTRGLMHERWRSKIAQ